jgi:hypothetical protein
MIGVGVARAVFASLIGLAATPVHPDNPKARQTMSAMQAKRIRKLAEEYFAAFDVGNYARAVDLMYPTLVKIAGGRSKMIEMLREIMRGTGEDMKADASMILATQQVNEPKQIVTVGENQFAILLLTARVDAPGATLQIKSFIIAISSDHGRSWTFIDGAVIAGAKLTRQDLTKVVPGFPAQLSLPVIEQRITSH